MKQIQIIKALKIHLSEKNIKDSRSARHRLKNNIYCYITNKYLLKCKNEIITQLDILINCNDIDLCLLKELGLYETIRTEIVNYKPSCSYFENYIFRNNNRKEKVIDNMLNAILLLDYSNYNTK